MDNFRLFLALIYYCLYYSSVLGVPLSNFSRAITVNGCGESSFSPEGPDRIVGGRYAERGEYPWMISLHENGGEGFEHVCGATVLNENWIITAAHCIELINQPWKYKALAGLHRLSQEDAKYVQRIKISEMFIHEKYDDDTLVNDIALLRTVRPIDITGSKGRVNGICLPKTNEDPKGYATVIGWGHTYEDGENSDILKTVSVPIIKRDLCNAAYDYDPLDGVDEILDTMICAGMRNRDSCQNDSGGPLFQTDKEGVATLIGIVSGGGGCGEKYYPGIYTKVAAYMDWIQKVVSK